jgi:hypothetical protein
MFVAGSAEQAAAIARTLVRAAHEDERLPDVRIGLGAGEVLVRDGDVFGPTVNRAARLVKVAEPSTVWVDGEVAARVPDAAVVALGERILPGFDEPVRRIRPDEVAQLSIQHERLDVVLGAHRRVETGVGEPERAPYPLREVIVDTRTGRRGAERQPRAVEHDPLGRDRVQPVLRDPGADLVDRRTVLERKVDQGALLVDLRPVEVEHTELDELLVPHAHRSDPPRISRRAVPHPIRHRSTTRHRGRAP